ncbi:MAG: [protein-PII] uridylyltransferase [Methylococcales bacterium]|nr:[protein-PII] uridylyltransferase [Methylococcales bacterium]
MSIFSGLFSTTQPVGEFKALMKTQAENLEQQFNPHNDVIELIHQKSDFIDELVSTIWHHFMGDFALKFSLIAVGGYGRRELFPFSDVDILVLLDQSDEQRYQEKLSTFNTFLWDIGLKLGLSVRTLKECRKVAIEDQTVMTSLLEMRLIAGHQRLYDKLKYYRVYNELMPSDTFFAAKIEEQHQRYFKANQTAFNLEPDTKEGPGGLRDLQVIGWVFKYQYKSETLRELIKHGFIPESEYQELIEARNIIWRIRYALHLLTGRSENRLLFDYQRALAMQFGFTTDYKNQNIEEFMQFYFKTVVGVERLNEMLLQLFSERFICPKGDCKAIMINHSFVAINGYLEAQSNSIFERQPLLLLSIILLLQQNPQLKGIRATTIRLIRKSLPLINDEFRHNTKANQLFIEILRHPHGITHQLRRMNRYGILAAYLPAFANIVSRMQYDLVHIYTVDVHTLFVIGNLRRFALKTHQQELPFCYDVFQLISKPEVLYLAGLFHDIAKGMGGDHSELGEVIAIEFCQQHQLSTHDSKLVSWLVRNHLLMSMTAQRKDISDPEIIYEFSSQVNTIERLNYLYLLTVADIRATSSSLWSSWKDSLLKQLYNASLRALHRNLQNPISISKREEENKKDATEMLFKEGLSLATIEDSWSHTNQGYFLRYSTDEIVWHTLAISASNKTDLPLVLLRSQSKRGSADVFVYAKNEAMVFSISTSSLDHLNLTILDAHISTTDDKYVLNSFQVIEQSGEPITDERQKKRICESLRHNLLKKHIKEQKNIHRQSRQAKHFPLNNRVEFEKDPLKRYTIIELITTDRAGLLSDIGQIFITLNIQLHDAKITTIGSRAEDIFYVTDLKGQLLSPEQENKFKVTLLTQLDSE